MDNEKLIPFTIPSHMPGMGGWGNGYVAISKEHPCYKMGYDEIHNQYDIDVHGGLTYANFMEHEAAPKDYWIVGFDTLHCGDGEGLTEEWVRDEAKRLCQQLANLKLTSHYESETDIQKQLTQLKEINAQLLVALKEVVRISDRKHDAWDLAKTIITKAERQ